MRLRKLPQGALPAPCGQLLSLLTRPSQLGHAALLAPATPLLDEAVPLHDVAHVGEGAPRHLRTHHELELRAVQRAVAAALVIRSEVLQQTWLG